MSSEQYCLFDTPLGPIGIAWSGQGLVRLQLPESDARATAATVAPPAPIEAVIAEIRRYLAGEAVDFREVTLDLAAVGAFPATVYGAAREVGWGQTTTYGALAHAIGFPWGARAVGRALGRNPVPIIVPCHRIVARDGRPGGFSAPGGVETKQRLLALEGVHLGGTPLLPGIAPPGAATLPVTPAARCPDRPPAGAGAPARSR